MIMESWATWIAVIEKISIPDPPIKSLGIELNFGRQYPHLDPLKKKDRFAIEDDWRGRKEEDESRHTVSWTRKYVVNHSFSFFPMSQVCSEISDDILSKSDDVSSLKHQRKQHLTSSNRFPNNPLPSGALSAASFCEWNTSGANSHPGPLITSSAAFLENFINRPLIGIVILLWQIGFVNFWIDR